MKRIDGLLKKLEDRCPAEPLRITIMWFGPTLPDQAEVIRINREGNGRVIVGFRLYKAPGLSEVEQKSACQGVRPPPRSEKIDDL